MEMCGLYVLVLSIDLPNISPRFLAMQDIATWLLCWTIWHKRDSCTNAYGPSKNVTSVVQRLLFSISFFSEWLEQNSSTFTAIPNVKRCRDGMPKSMQTR